MLKTNVKKANSTDDDWIRKHFSQLVDKYAGMYAVVAEGELFLGRNAKKLTEKAESKHPNVIPTGFRIPRPEDFNCAL